MGRAKEAAAEAVNAVVDGAAAAASAADTASTDLAESIGAKVGTIARRREARLPGPVRFSLAVVLSFALSSLGRSFVDHYSQNEVGSIMREEISRTELGVLAAWRLYVFCECTLRAEEVEPLFSCSSATLILTRTAGLG
jgi:hypothetical protein